MEQNYIDNIYPEKLNTQKIILCSTLNNNEILYILNNFFKVFNIIFFNENNRKINCIKHFVGKKTGPVIILFDIELHDESKDNYISSIHLINKLDKSFSYSLQELYNLLKKYIRNTITFNDFDNIFTFSSNKIKDSDIIQSLNICHNMMAVDTIFSLKILLLLAHQAPEFCLDEIDTLFKLLSKHMLKSNKTLISEYVIVILSILSSNSKSIKRFLPYLDIMFIDYDFLENITQSCHIKFMHHYILIIFGNIINNINNINIIQHFKILDRIKYNNIFKIKKDLISNGMTQYVKNIDNYIFRLYVMFGILLIAFIFFILYLFYI